MPRREKFHKTIFLLMPWLIIVVSSSSEVEARCEASEQSVDIPQRFVTVSRCEFN